MSADEVFLFLHLLAAFWYAAGLTAVQISLIRGAQNPAIAIKAQSFDEASHYQGMLLVPGAIATVATGVFYWGQLDYGFFTTGWLLVVEACYIVTLLVCLPLAGMGLRRARIAALQAERTGNVTPALEAAMADTVPLFFAGIATLLIPVATFFAVFRPF